MLSKKRNILQLDKRDQAKEYSVVDPSRQPLAGQERNEFFDVGLVDPMDKSEMVVYELVDFISKQGYRPDQKLPSEKELCKIIGVGNRTIREALYCLKGIGIVKSQQGTGWYVKEFDLSSSLKFISPLLKNFSGADLTQILQMRLALEPVIAQYAAEYITVQGLEHLAHTLHMMSTAEGGTESSMFWRYDRKFHDVIAEECGNHLISMMNSILTGLYLSAWFNFVKSDKSVVIQHHQEIYEAIGKRDGNLARELSEKHIQLAIEAIRKNT